MPVVHMASIVPISQSVGANRIIPTVAIPHPLGNPTLPREEEVVVRRKLVEKALKALSTDVSEQTVF
jgi:glycine reductase